MPFDRAPRNRPKCEVRPSCTPQREQYSIFKVRIKLINIAGKNRRTEEGADSGNKKGAQEVILAALRD